MQPFEVSGYQKLQNESVPWCENRRRKTSDFSFWTMEGDTSSSSRVSTEFPSKAKSLSKTTEKGERKYLLLCISRLLALLLLHFNQPCAPLSKKEKLNMLSLRTTSPIPRQNCCCESGGTKGLTHFYSAHMPVSAGGEQDSERRTGRSESGGGVSNY